MVTESKYKVILVAYKDLDEKEYSKLAYNFISIIKTDEDIRTSCMGDFKSTAGLSCRTGMYHKWFYEDILRKLSLGYGLGIIETRIGSRKAEQIEEELQELGEKIIVVDTCAM